MIRERLTKHSYIAFSAQINAEDWHAGRIKVGKGCVVGSFARLSGNIILDEKVEIGEQIILAGFVKIGRMSYLSGGYSELNAEGNKILIGNFCSIARNVFIRTTDHHLDRLTTSPRIFSEYFKGSEYCKNRGDVEIGHDVWIGANVTILGGVSIGNGAVIAAGAIVTKSVASYAIVGGNPAKLLRMRFNPITIAKLESMGWWDWTDKEIYENKSAFVEPLDAT